MPQGAFRILIAKYFESLCSPGVLSFGYGAYTPFNEVLLMPAEGEIAVYASEPERHESILTRLGIKRGQSLLRCDHERCKYGEAGCFG